MHRLLGMKVQDIMTKSPACCTPDTSLQEVARLMVAHDCGCIPVVDSLDSRRPIGTITDRDITVRAVATGRDLPTARARDCMSAPCTTISTSASLNECIDLLEEKQLRRVVVVDETGACCGIVAQADIAEHASKRKAGELVRKVSENADGARQASGSAMSYARQL
jgi:CBS domain-containing protein